MKKLVSYLMMILVFWVVIDKYYIQIKVGCDWIGYPIYKQVPRFIIENKKEERITCKGNNNIIVSDKVEIVYSWGVCEIVRIK